MLAIGFAALLTEMLTLHGIAAIAAIGALALYFGAHVVTGSADGAVAILAGAGVLGILFEFHVLPGHGFAGVLGAITLAAAVLFSFGAGALPIGAQALAVAIVFGIAGCVLASRFVPGNAFVRRFSFAGTQGSDYVTSANFRSLLGEVGIASSYLRPAGVALIAGKRVDVLTEGSFVPAGNAVEVTRVEGARIFVRGIEPLR